MLKKANLIEYIGITILFSLSISLANTNATDINATTKTKDKHLSKFVVEVPHSPPIPMRQSSNEVSKETIKK